jgi:hypothetical protein
MLRSLLSRLVGQLAMWDADTHTHTHTHTAGRPYDVEVEDESIASDAG